MAITVKIIKQNAPGNSEAPPIHDNMLLDNNMARHRGLRFLDDPDQGTYYSVKKRIFKVPHKGVAIVPNEWIDITDYHLGLSATLMKVIRYRIEITPSGVWGIVEADEYIEV